MKRFSVTKQACLREQNTALKSVNVGVLAITCGLLSLCIGCAKTDVQAPPKEAPTGVTVTNDDAPAAEAQQGPSSVGAPPPPAVEQNQSWPEARKPSAAAREESLEVASEGQARPASAPMAARKSSSSAPKPSGAVSKSKDAASQTEGGRGAETESADDLLVRINTASEQLTRDYARLTEALELGVPDCQAAQRLRRSVCELADSVCELEQDLPKTTGRRCDDSKRRCSEATRRYEAKCVE